MINSLKKEFTIGCTYGFEDDLVSYKVMKVLSHPKRIVEFLCSDGTVIQREVGYSGNNGEMLTLYTDMTHSYIFTLRMVIKWRKLQRVKSLFRIGIKYTTMTNLNRP